MKAKITICRWYATTAIYNGDELISVSLEQYMPDTWLARVLGYDTEKLEDIPTHDRPKEFDWKDNDRLGGKAWVPPKSMSVLLSQWEAYRERLKRERIESLRSELASLESEA